MARGRRVCCFSRYVPAIRVFILASMTQCAFQLEKVPTKLKVPGSLFSGGIAPTAGYTAERERLLLLIVCGLRGQFPIKIHRAQFLSDHTQVPYLNRSGFRCCRYLGTIMTK